jgi:DNA polymerase-1
MSLDLEALAAKAKALGEAALLPVLETTELHVDGDYAAYYFSGNDETPFGDGRANMVRTLKAVRRIAGAGGRAVIHLTAGGSDKGGRYKIATVKPYQEHREGKTKPKNWSAMREWLEAGTVEGFTTKVWTDREADDGCAAAARYAFQSGHRPALYSRDKDFRMIPGRHISWTTLGITEVDPTAYAVTDEEGLIYGQKWFWMQMLMGDPTDNIPGLPGQPAKEPGKFKNCGEVCALHWLSLAERSEQAFPVVRSLYQKFYAQAWAPAFAEQAALLWLRTDNKASPADFMRAIPAVSPELEQAARLLERRVA